MDAICVIRVWLILALVVCPCLQLSIRRRSIASYRNENPYELNKALAAIERQRIAKTEYSRGELNNDDLLQPATKNIQMLPANSYDDIEADPEIYIPVRESDLSELLSAYEDNHRLKAETIPVDDGHHRTVPSLYELQQIFPEASETISEGDEASNSDFVEQDTFEEETGQENKEQMQTLFEAADELEQENLDDLSKEADTDTTQEVSTEELETVFANNDNKEEAEPTPEYNEKKRSSGDINEHDTTLDSRYKLLKKYIEESKTNKRRMSKRDEKSGVMPSNNELFAEIIKLKDELEKMKMTQAMEDKENDYLASALKGATLSQLDGSDAFLKGEFDDIQNAIKLEELLQNVKIDDDNENDSTDNEDGNVYDEKRAEPPSDEIFQHDEEEFVPRSQFISPSLEDNLGRWYDQPSIDEDDREAFMKPPLYDDDDALLLENFANQYSPQSNMNIQDVSVPVTEETEFDEGLKKVNNILTAMTPEERDDLRYQIESILTYEDAAEECTPASLLSSDCRFADLLQLPIDEEARRLCNRHEICYTCAESIGMTAVQCDAGYRGDAMEICGEDEQCDEDASLFLGLMQEKHRYIPYQSDFCSAPCIHDYIIGL